MPELLEKIPVAVVLLDEDRQVVFGRERLLALAGSEIPGRADHDGIGDLVGCVNSIAADGGCGTGEACSLCGAFCAISASRERGTAVTRECRLRYRRNELENDLDLTVTAAPYESGGTRYTLVTVQDSSGEKRRRALERLFFHDITNLAGGLAGLAGVVKTVQSTVEREEMLGMMEQSARALLDEIDAQRQLATAERGELRVTATTTNSLALLARVVDSLRYHQVAEGRRIVVSDRAESFDWVVDPTLLRRVLVNLAKNALEAVGLGGVVTLDARRRGDTVRCTVHNDGVIPVDVQHQLFQRSFSTKGDGRGLGTYSVRLLAEQYLHGRVSFTSTEENGTLFSVDLPATVG